MFLSNKNHLQSLYYEHFFLASRCSGSVEPIYKNNKHIFKLQRVLHQRETREYTERPSESKTSLDQERLSNRKRDFEAYQGIVSEGFYLGFWFWTIFLAGFLFGLR